MQHCAEIHFWGRLRQLRDPAPAVVEYRFNGCPAIKDSIEALGIPHTEVDLILVGGRAVAFDYRLNNADKVDIYPVDNAAQADSSGHLSPPIPEPLAFILDVHLGKLARRLRMLGFDCRYRNDYSDPQIIELALAENLVILTRDRGILKHARVLQGYLVASGQVEQQLREVLRRYRLYDRILAFSRCPSCNGLLEAVEKAEIISQLPPKTARYYRSFQRCCDCGQLYWQGSHYAKIESWLQQLREEP